MWATLPTSSSGGMAEDDDMPPLEYVGASSPLDEPLREGDRVALRGLSKKELNGQKGTLQSFTQAAQGRLAVKLDSGQRVSIKPENLAKLDSQINGNVVDAQQMQQSADDSDMPPLQYVGGAVPNGNREDHQWHLQRDAAEDDMPPLEYAGNAASASSRGPVKQADDDDMPPLEYVGASSALDEPLREGDRVALRGLSKKELNGQKGTLQSFTQAAQGRLAVKLDSGQRMSIKPENLAKLDLQINGNVVDAQQMQQSADDSDMPPLEYVGGAVPNGNREDHQWHLQRDAAEDDMPPLEYAGNAASASSRGPVKQADDDDMPPLEYVGASSPLDEPLREGDRVALRGLSKKELNGQKGTLQSFTQAAQGRLAVKLDSGQRVSIKPENLAKLDSQINGNVVDAQQMQQSADDSDMPPLEYVGGAVPNGNREDHQWHLQRDAAEDDMPPLEYAGNAASASSRGPVKQADDDDMPPLEYVGASSPLDEPLREGDRVALRGLSKKELNGQKGTLQSFTQAAQGRLAVKLDSGQRVSIKPENLAKLDSQITGNVVDAQQMQQSADDSDMPPLEYVGGAVPNGNREDHQWHLQRDAAEDDMPPLEYAGNAASASSRGPVKQADDDDMPPLEYVGASSPLDEPLREGDRVALRGLSKKELNGQKGTLQSFTQAAQGRLAVKLDSGQRVSIKPENLAKLDLQITGNVVDAQQMQQSADDSDMPPLEYVGGAVPNFNREDHQWHLQRDAAEDDMPPLEYAGNAASASSRGPVKQADDDDMPPLEYVGASSPLDEPLREGDRVALRGLSRKELNRQKGTLQSFTQAAQGRLAVKLDSGQRVSIKPENLAKLDSQITGNVVDAQQMQQSADDSDMPPLEYVGGAVPNGNREDQSHRAGESMVASRQAKDGDEDDMPPLEYVGQDLSAGLSLLEGDRVMLKGLSKAGLDGQVGKLENFSRATKGRLPVKLDSGQLLAVKPVNLEKLDAATSEPLASVLDQKMAPKADGVPFAKGRMDGPSGRPAESKSCPDVSNVDDEDVPPLEPADIGDASRL